MPIEPHVLLAGRLVATGDARISPFDRGFLFGDGLYEGIKVLSGVPLFLDRHLARLAGGLTSVRIALDLDRLENELRGLLRANGTVDGFLYLQVTRGAAPERRHLPPGGLEPTVFAFVERRGFDPPAGAPQKAVTRRDIRWRRADLKGASLLATTLGKLAAADHGAHEVLWRDGRGRLLEGGNTNVFVRGPKGLETAPRSKRILAGITRDLVLDLAETLGLPVLQQGPDLAQRAAWLEVFVTGTVTGVQAVTSLDGVPVAHGRVGEWTERLAAALDRLERATAAAGNPA